MRKHTGDEDAVSSVLRVHLSIPSWGKQAIEDCQKYLRFGGPSYAAVVAVRYFHRLLQEGEMFVERTDGTDDSLLFDERLLGENEYRQKMHVHLTEESDRQIEWCEKELGVKNNGFILACAAVHLRAYFNEVSNGALVTISPPGQRRIAYDLWTDHVTEIAAE